MIRDKEFFQNSHPAKTMHPIILYNNEKKMKDTYSPLGEKAKNLK